MVQIASKSALLSVLSQRHFRYLWLAQIASMLALNILIFLLALLVYQTTKSNAAVSGLFLAYGIPAVFFGLVSGAIVDRLDRRIVLILCDISRAILAVSLLFFTQKVAVVYLFVFVHAIINQFYVPSEAPTIPKLVPQPLLVTANSLFSFTYYGSMAAGFILAGPVLRLFGPTGSLVLVSLLFLLAAFSVRQIPAQGEGLRSLSKLSQYSPLYLIQRVLTGLLEGIGYISQSKSLVDALLLLTGTQVVIALLGALGPGFADQLLNIDVRDASVIIIGPVVLGIVLGALWVGNIGYHFGAKKLIETGIMLAGILLIIIAITVRLYHLRFFWFTYQWFLLALEIVLFFLLGVANSLLDVPANTALQRQSTEAMRGRVYGMLATAVGGIGILPVVIGGVLADLVGVGKVILLLGLTVASYGVYRIRYNRSYKF